MFAASAGRASYRDVDANADAMKGGMRRCAALKIVALLASGRPLLSVAASPRDTHLADLRIARGVIRAGKARGTRPTDTELLMSARLYRENDPHPGCTDISRSIDDGI